MAGAFRRCTESSGRSPSSYPTRIGQRSARLGLKVSPMWIASWSNFDTRWTPRYSFEWNENVAPAVPLVPEPLSLHSACISLGACSYELLSNDNRSISGLSAQTPIPLRSGRIDWRRYSWDLGGSPRWRNACSESLRLSAKLADLHCYQCPRFRRRRRAPLGKFAGHPGLSAGHHLCYLPCFALVHIAYSSASSWYQDQSLPQSLITSPLHNDTARTVLQSSPFDSYSGKVS